MGINERKIREKEMKILAIVDAAEKCFFEKGLNNTSMEDVAKRSEYSKGTLYLYFKNKDELAAAVVIRAIEKLQGYLANCIDEQATGLEQVCAAAKGYYQFSQDFPEEHTLMMDKNFCHDETEEMPNTSRCFSMGNSTLLILKDMLKRGVDDGSIRDDINIDVLPIVLWGQISGVIELLVRENIQKKFESFQPLDLKLLVDETISLIKNSLKK